MGLSGMVLSAVSAVTGAIMYWATTAQSSAVAQQHGFRLSTLGVILMVAGVVGFVISAIVFASSRRSPAEPTHTLDREVIDGSGSRTEVHQRQS
jgi:phosphate/sulfate permease